MSYSCSHSPALATLPLESYRCIVYDVDLAYISLRVSRSSNLLDRYKHPIRQERGSSHAPAMTKSPMTFRSKVRVPDRQRVGERAALGKVRDSPQELAPASQEILESSGAEHPPFSFVRDVSVARVRAYQDTCTAAGVLQAPSVLRPPRLCRPVRLPEKIPSGYLPSA